MNIVLADVKSIQAERVDSASGEIATDDEFSRLVDRQLRKDEELSTQVEYPQAIENKEKISEADESSAMFEQSPDGFGGLNAEILSNLTELEISQVALIVDETE
ncbi:MAG: hypothetical protein HKN34_11605, partial [Gammaproteobacteria bacterium]|nr:hypothetical protein [Gammaproteobacteria bacterium]